MPDEKPISITPLPLPERMEDPGTGDFAAVTELMNAASREAWGNDDFRIAPESLLGASLPSPLRKRVYLTARSGGAVIGMAALNFPLTDNTHAAMLNIVTDQAFRGRGVGSALLAAAQHAAASEGRRVLMGETEHPLPPEGTAQATEAGVPAATGTGEVPRDGRAGFALLHGFGLEQVERLSRLDLAGIAAGSVTAAPDGYELLSWRGPCPEELVDSYARLRQAMSTDAPLGAMDIEEEVWDAARVRELEGKAVRMEADTLVSAARSVRTGELAGHTMLMVYNENPEIAYQEDTLVLRAHRGHGLGMVLKSANLLRLRREFPETERVYTWNAAENTHMLAINVALGFRPVGYSGEWQKTFA